MLGALRAAGSALGVCRATTSSTILGARTLTSASVARPVPPKRGEVQSPDAFLKAIGRKAEEKVTETDWEKFWKMGSVEFRGAELAVRDRRYIMWAMNKYRLGQDPSTFAHEARPKKKVRGWGPSVQNGKRIRSRRKR